MAFGSMLNAKRQCGDRTECVNVTHKTESWGKSKSKRDSADVKDGNGSCYSVTEKAEQAAEKSASAGSTGGWGRWGLMTGKEDRCCSAAGRQDEAAKCSGSWTRRPSGRWAAATWLQKCRTAEIRLTMFIILGFRGGLARSGPGGMCPHADQC